MIYRYQSNGKIFEVTLERQGGNWRAIVDGLPYDFEVLDDSGGAQDGAITLRVEGRPVMVDWAIEGGRKWLAQSGCAYLLEKPAATRRGREGDRAAESSLRAPMPAQVRTIEAQPGDEVQKGQTLLVLEAMKMEIRLQAPRAGRVARLLVTLGQQVNRDQTLLELEE